MAAKILVVDDEPEIAQLVALYLQNDGFSVQTAATAGEALALIEQEEPALALLDVMLPDMSGFELCRKLREKYLFPVIMLTAKPFNPLELAARVKTQLRRYTRYNTGAAAEPSREIDLRGLRINRDSHRCLLFERELSLTPLEFEILWYLCEQRGRVVSSEELFEKVWGEKYLDSNNTVMSHIARLREKMGEPARKPRFIRTVWGVGYTVE